MTNTAAEQILQSVRDGDGQAVYDFAEVLVTKSDVAQLLEVPPGFLGVRFMCLRDSVTLSGVRVPMTPPQLQQLADLLDCMLPTPRLLDWRHIAARARGIAVEPTYRVGPTIAAEADGPTIAAEADLGAYNMAVSWAVEHAFNALPLSRRVETMTAPVDGVGKSWVLINELAGRTDKKVYNYGWHGRASWLQFEPVTRGAWRVGQPVAGAHNYAHVDPSQGTFGLFAREAMVHWEHGDQLTTIEDLGHDDVLGRIVSHQRYLHVHRLPGVPVTGPSVRLGGAR